jgi:hypothetical protein
MTRRLLGAFALTGLLAGSFTTTAFGATPAGTVISNAATASYGDGTGATYTAQSNTVTTTVQNVTTATVTAVSPGTNVAPYQLVDDQYTITNTGNGVGTWTINIGAATTQTTGGNGGSAPSIASITLTTSGGTTTNCAAGAGQAACLSAFLSAHTTAGGDYITVDVIYNDGSYVQPTGATQVVGTQLNATMQYLAASNGGNTTTSVTPANATVTDTLQADALVDVQKTSPALTTGAQNVVYTLTANNRGYLNTQPVALPGTGLPATGVVISDPLPAGLTSVANRWVSLPTIALANGAAGTADLYYTTSTVAAVASGTATWTKITSGGSTLAALNAVTGITAVAGVISGVGSTLNGSAQVAHGASSGPGSVTSAQVTISMTFVQKPGETDVNLADAVIGSNAMPVTPGTVVAMVTGPANAQPQTVSAANVGADMVNTSAAPPGSGYSNQVTNVAVAAAVLLGPGGQASATGAFSFAAGNAAGWEAGAANNSNDYTALGFLSGSTIVNTGTPPTFTAAVSTGAAPAVIPVRQTIRNNGNVADQFTLSAAGFTDTPLSGGSAWTVTYSAASNCAGATATFTTASVGVGATTDVYACWTPPASTLLNAMTAYGGTITATSVASSSATNTTNDVFFPGGFLQVQKTVLSVTGTPAAAGAPACSLATPTSGCVINYQISYTVVLPKGSGTNNITPAGATNFQLFEDGKNGVNSSGTNNWGVVGSLNAAPALTNGPTANPTVTYFTGGAIVTAVGTGSAQGPLGSTVVPAGTTGVRLDFGTVPIGGGAAGSGTVSFGVKIS